MPRTRGARPAPAAGATPACILVVDDSAATLELIQRNLALQGYDVHTSQGAADALALLDAMAVDLVVTDVRMPGLSGIDLIREVRQRHPGIELVVITGYATIQGAVEALCRIGDPRAAAALQSPARLSQLIADLKDMADAVRSAAPEVMTRLVRGEPVDPALVYFRCMPRFEVSSAALASPRLRSVFLDKSSSLVRLFEEANPLLW